MIARLGFQITSDPCVQLPFYGEACPGDAQSCSSRFDVATPLGNNSPELRRCPTEWYYLGTLYSAQGSSSKQVDNMVWTAPVFEEISLCCEINSYASAKQ